MEARGMMSQPVGPNHADYNHIPTIDGNDKPNLTISRLDIDDEPSLMERTSDGTNKKVWNMDFICQIIWYNYVFMGRDKVIFHLLCGQKFHLLIC